MNCSFSINRFQALSPILCLLSLGCGKGAPQTASSSSDTIDLSDYRWKNRIVLVFAESDASPAHHSLMNAWTKAQEGVKDRHLLLFQVFDCGTSIGPRGPMSSTQADNLRAKFATSDEPFLVVLIGKDSGVKLSSTDASLRQIFELIDSMPMRRAEMQEQQAKPKE
jgi:hypothetical protein